MRIVESFFTIVSAVYLYLFIISALGLCLWIVDNFRRKSYDKLLFAAIYLSFAFSYRIVAGISSKRYAIFLIVPGIYCAVYLIERLSSRDFWSSLPKNQILNFLSKCRTLIAGLVLCFLLCSFFAKDYRVNKYSNAFIQIGETTQQDSKRNHIDNYISTWTDYFSRFRFYCDACEHPIQLQPEWDATDSSNYSMIQGLKTCNFPFYIIRKKSVKETDQSGNLPIVRLYEAFDSNRKNRVLQCWRYENPVQYDIEPDPSENLFSNGDLSKSYSLKQRYPNVVSQMIARGQSFFENDNITIPENLIIGGIFDIDSSSVYTDCSEDGFIFSSGSFFSWYSQQKFVPDNYYYSVRLQPEEESFFRLGICTFTPTGIQYRQLGMFRAEKDSSDRLFTVLIEPSDSFSPNFQLFFLMAEGRVRIREVYLTKKPTEE